MFCVPNCGTVCKHLIATILPVAFGRHLQCVLLLRPYLSISDVQCVLIYQHTL